MNSKKFVEMPAKGKSMPKLKRKKEAMSRALRARTGIDNEL